MNPPGLGSYQQFHYCSSICLTEMFVNFSKFVSVQGTTCSICPWTGQMRERRDANRCVIRQRALISPHCIDNFCLMAKWWFNVFLSWMTFWPKVSQTSTTTSVWKMHPILAWKSTGWMCPATRPTGTSRTTWPESADTTASTPWKLMVKYFCVAQSIVNNRAELVSSYLHLFNYIC